MVSCKLLFSVSFGTNLLSNVLLNINDALSVLEINVIYFNLHTLLSGLY